MYRSFSAVILVTLAGCVLASEQYVNKLKDQSLEEFPSDVIDVVVSFPENEGRDKISRTMPATVYLGFHTGLVYVGDELDEDTFQDIFSKTTTLRTDTGIRLRDLPMFDIKYYVGAAVPISDDGYFLTVGHGMNESYQHLLYLTSDKERTYADAQKCRLVLRDRQADLAIVKVEMDTPRYLSLRETPLTKGEVVYGGNWYLGQCSAGEYIDVFIEGDGTVEPGAITDGAYLKISNPGLSGDSGSPLIDRNGKLCGVISGGDMLTYIRAKKFQHSVATGLDQNAIMEIIARDRKDSQLKATTTTLVESSK